MNRRDSLFFFLPLFLPPLSRGRERDPSDAHERMALVSIPDESLWSGVGCLSWVGSQGGGGVRWGTDTAIESEKGVVGRLAQWEPPFRPGGFDWWSVRLSPNFFSHKKRGCRVDI